MTRTENASWPTNPIAAVTHPEPGPYYRHLASLPLHFDNELQCWIAASPRTVRAVLDCEALRVRPPHQRVPAHLVDTAAGDLFSRLARMNDGDGHHEMRTMIDQVIASISSQQLERVCEEIADSFLAAHKHTAAEWMFEYPSQVLAVILDVERNQLDSTVGAARLIANAFAPGAANIDGAKLDAAVSEILSTIGNGHLTALARGLLQHKENAEANLAGWFFQIFDSTAGLIGNSLLAALLSPPMTAERSIVDNTLRCCPPIQNTRRFAHTDIIIDTEQIRTGDSVLIVLAAASPDLNATEAAAYRSSQQTSEPAIAFGSGPHRCPADQIVTTIATHALIQLMKLGHTAELTGYLPSPNARIPTFQEGTKSQ